MPFINVKLTVPVSDEKKEILQGKIADHVATALGKPRQYIMTSIETEKDLWFAGKKMDNGAFIAVSTFGTPSRSGCEDLTKKFCATLAAELGTPGSQIYVAYYPLENWGWNSMNF